MLNNKVPLTGCAFSLQFSTSIGERLIESKINMM